MKRAIFSVRRSSSRFMYAVRRGICLPRNYVVAENWRRFWYRHGVNVRTSYGTVRKAVWLE